MGGPDARIIAVEHAGQVAAARSAARTYAADLGFDERECERIALVASELATNLVTHGGGGTLTLEGAQEEARTGIRLVAEDAGPGIADLERALTDGYSTTGGLGLGLGTVHRLMDDLKCQTPARGGLRVVCHRWIRPRELGAVALLIDCGVATRPRRGSNENGDAFIVRQEGRQALVGLIDGLGHGEWAQQAAQQARFFVEEHCEQPLEQLFAGVDRACRRTRGVVMALARFEAGARQFEFASVGNIEAKLFGATEARDFIVRRGVLGLNAPRPVVTRHGWSPATILVLQSDGVTTHWNWHDFPHAIWTAPTEAAHRMLLRLAKDDDDATLVVVRHAEHPA